MQLELDDVISVVPVPTPIESDDILLMREDGVVAAPMSSFPGFLRGMDGQPGTPGTPGIAGKDGERGSDGQPGLSGGAGRDGERGSDGQPGTNGQDGRDGLDGLPGGAGEGFTWRGQYARGETYRPMDVVRFSGSAFVCLKESTGVMPSGRAVQGFGAEDAAWDIMAVQGDSGPHGADGTIGHDGVDGTNGAGVLVGGTTDQVLAKASNADFDTKWVTVAGTGTVTDVSVVTANGVSGSVATSTSTPAITLTLGAITPTSIAASGTVTGSNLSGTNTGDYTNENAQDAVGTILTDTATIDFTYDDAGNAITADVKDGSITLAKMAGMNTASLIYRKTAATGVPEVNTLATLKTDLGLTGTNSGDQTITLTSDVTGSGTGSFATTIANSAVTYAKMQNVSATDKLLGRSTAGAGVVEEIGLTAAGRALIDDASATAQVTTLGLDNTKIASITVVIDGGGSVITTGVKRDIVIPYACTINSVTMLADVSGSIVVDLWKDTYANYPPTVADTITASAKPTITTATKSQDTTLTGWTASVTAGDIIRPNVDSVTTITALTLVLKVTKT